MTADLVFLLDVDNTLLDGDRIVADLHDHVKRVFDAACAQRYWAIFDAMREELGYVDYLGALQRYRLEAVQGNGDEQQQLLTVLRSSSTTRLPIDSSHVHWRSLRTWATSARR